MPDLHFEQEPPRSRAAWRRVALGGLGIALGGAFLWLAVRDMSHSDIEAALRQVDSKWLVAGIVSYLASIGLRCVRWGILLRATQPVKWRHVTEAMLTGFTANYLMPGRVGELFRADYARRVFNMSRFVSLGTIVVERVCDGVVLVCALWVGFAWLVITRFVGADTLWILTAGGLSTALFAAALAFLFMARRIDLRRFGAPQSISMRWDRLVEGVSSISHANMKMVVLCSIAVWSLELQALASVVYSFGVALSLPEALLLQTLASLSTLVPTAPGYLGTYQLVFREVFQLFGYSPGTGVIAATAVQVFFFGTVTVFGGIVLVSRSGLTIWRGGHKDFPEKIVEKHQHQT